jgi:hypothetical protein
MTIRLDNSVFIHTPRTGGTWLQEVLRVLGLDRQVLRGDLDGHLLYAALPVEWAGLTLFSFIRHPLLWVKSRWTHAVEIHAHPHGRHFGVHRRFDRCVRETFSETLSAIVVNEPGLVSNTFMEMTEGIPVENLVCTIDLPDQAHRLLSRLEGLPEDRLEAVRAVGKINSTSNRPRWQAQLNNVPKSLVQEFMATESWALELWRSRLVTKELSQTTIP